MDKMDLVERLFAARAFQIEARECVSRLVSRSTALAIDSQSTHEIGGIIRSLKSAGELLDQLIKSEGESDAP